MGWTLGLSHCENTETKYVREQSAEKDVWAYVGRGNKGMEKIT